MLNKDDEVRLRYITEDIGTESFGMNTESDLNDTKWLIDKVLKLQDEIEELTEEIDELRLRKDQLEGNA